MSVSIAAAAVVAVIAALSLFFGVIKPTMDRVAVAQRIAENRAAEEQRIAEARQTLANPSVGDTVYFGDAYWRVLEVQDGQALLISQDILEQRAYNDEDTAVSWETCTLRAYLNGEFLNSHFSTEEQGRIALTEVINNDNPEYGTDGGADTQDKLFLLSIEEAEQYFSSDNDRIATYQGADSWWWLRSPGGGAGRAVGVSGDGGAGAIGAGVDGDSHGLRPALWLNL
jgi:hypothetical protein